RTLGCHGDHLMVACRDVRALHALGVARGCAVLPTGLADTQACDHAQKPRAGGLCDELAVRSTPPYGSRSGRYSRRCCTGRSGTHSLSRSAGGTRACRGAVCLCGQERARHTQRAGRYICTAMKRPQRYLFIIMTVLVVVYLLLTRLPPLASLALLGMLALYVLIVSIWGRDLFFARRAAKRGEWAKAQARYEKLEKKLQRARWHRLAVVLYPNIYSFDGVAIMRNNIGQMLINAGELDQAVQWLRAALQRDPFYP